VQLVSRSKLSVELRGHLQRAHFRFAQLERDAFRSIQARVIASEAKQSSAAPPFWIASSLRSSQ
jgi:hypothetical protein